MSNENVFHKVTLWIKQGVKETPKNLKQGWAAFQADPLLYIKDALLARYGQLDFAYNRIRKVITTLRELKWWESLTIYVSDITSRFIELLAQVNEGQLAKTMEEARAALEKKREEIRAQLGKTPEQIEQELSQWESATKTAPLSLFFKLFNGISDLVGSLLLFIKTFKKVREVDARIQLVYAQTEFVKAFEKDRTAHCDAYKQAYDNYKKAFEQAIKTARDPILAQALLEAYIVTLRKLGGSEDKLKEIHDRLNKVTKYDDMLKKTKHAQAIAFHDVNLDKLKQLHDQSAYPDVDETLLDTDFNHITNMVFLKEKAEVFKHALRIINNNPIFSDIKDNRSAQQAQFSKEWPLQYRRYLEKTHQLKLKIKALEQSTIDGEYAPLSLEQKRELETLRTELAYLKKNNEKTLYLCDFTKMVDLENSEAKNSKLLTLFFSGALIINALISLIDFAFAIVALSTGNAAPVFRSAPRLLDTIVNFTVDKSMAFVDTASSSTFGWFRTWKKWGRVYELYQQDRNALEKELPLLMNDKINSLQGEAELSLLERIERRKKDVVATKSEYEKARKAYEAEIKKHPLNPENLSEEHLRLKDALTTTRETLLVKRMEYHTLIKKDPEANPSQNILLTRLKALRMLNRRSEYEKLKLIKKSSALLGSVLMFATLLITGPLAVIAGVIAFIAFPTMRRFASLEGQQETLREAIKLKLLPEGASESFKDKNFSIWLYAIFSFISKSTIEGPITIIKDFLVLLMKVLHWITKKINPNSTLLKQAIEKGEKPVFLSFLIAKEVQAEARKLNLISEVGSVVTAKNLLLLIIYAPISFILKVPQFTLKLIIIALMHLIGRSEESVRAVDQQLSYSIFYGIAYMIKQFGDWLTEPRNLRRSAIIEDIGELNGNNVSKLLETQSESFPGVKLQYMCHGNKISSPSFVGTGDLDMNKFHENFITNKKEILKLNSQDETKEAGEAKIKLVTLNFQKIGEDHQINCHAFFKLSIKQIREEEVVKEVYTLPLFVKS